VQNGSNHIFDGVSFVNKIEMYKCKICYQGRFLVHNENVKTMSFGYKI
jgi:hypothetical protein